MRHNTRRMASELAKNAEQVISKEATSFNISALKEYEKKIVDLTRRNRLLKYPSNGRAISFKMSISDFVKSFGSIEEMEIEFPHKAILAEDEMAENNEKDTSVPPTDIQGTNNGDMTRFGMWRGMI